MAEAGVTRQHTLTATRHVPRRISVYTCGIFDLDHANVEVRHSSWSPEKAHVVAAY
jgi:hypothetical protein